MVELAVLLFVSVFFVFALTVPVVTWATLRGLARQRLVDGLRAAGATDVASRGDEDAEREISLDLKLHGRALSVEAVERGEIPLWHIRADARGPAFVLSREGWRAPPALRELAGDPGDALRARFESELRAWTVARDDAGWFVEVRRAQSDAEDLLDAVQIAFRVVEPQSAAIGARPRALLTGAPVALPS